MRVIIIKQNELSNVILPEKIDGCFFLNDYDEEGTERQLAIINGNSNSWFIKASNGMKITYGNNTYEEIELKIYNFYKISTQTEELFLYCTATIESTYKSYSLEPQNEYLIGNSSEANIKYNLNVIIEKQAILKYIDDFWYIEAPKSRVGVYVNNERVSNKKLRVGDIIFIFGLKMVIFKDYIMINSICDFISCNLKPYNKENLVENENFENNDEEKTFELISKEAEYFHKSPRFKTINDKEEINIDAPPNKREKENMPLAYTLGPMLTMGMTSVVTAFTSINSMINNQKTLIMVLPTLVIAFSMLMTMIFWPTIARKYEKKQERKREKDRQEKYEKYISEKRDKIDLIIKLQSQILRDNFLLPEECSRIILNKKASLWSRNIIDNDFLSLRIGTGNSPIDLKINFKEEDFVMEEDNLKKMAESLVYETKILYDVPIGFSLSEKFIIGIVGEQKLTASFLETLLLQMTTFYGYDELKIALFTKETSRRWDYLRFLSHLFNSDKSVRFFAKDKNQMKDISLYLEKIFQSRKVGNNGQQNTNDYKSYDTYYVIITDDYENARELEIIKDVLEQKTNIGFSLIILNDKLAGLPNECKNFINIGEKSSGLFESEITYKNQKEFQAEFIESIPIEECVLTLANINLEILNEESNLPNVLGFLEMFNVGNVEQLNIANRWKNNNIISSLQTPIGVDISKNILFLDLHEKAHGPHGLIAGMTGSGKSEFIITYILSMAINYHPNEVSFVLIDYKGGGLAGAFQNKDTGLKLPHLAGTITNLDISDMTRALVSIQSELRRRQKVFNEARDLLGESTIDIYKYQRFYREGKVDTPISHLFIISDEFAELKQQQPDFMDQLISTARIGRSLGVHLILATQKPNGVVNDQIWSNSRFKVCLKVQEKNDSMDMIKSPLAAEIKTTGRFYLQVGYNEMFTIGQSAWTGKKYYPSEKITKKIDTSINFIDNVANVIKSVDLKRSFVEAKGEEFTTVLSHIIDLSKAEGAQAQQLWYPKIEPVIYVKDLQEKYTYETNEYIINPIIGEYDDPFNQRQGILTLNLSENGNTIIYGMAGSGKELFLTTTIYSIINHHSPEEVNIYIMDFGAESLKMFCDSPQVGDVLSISDSENIDKLLKMLEKEISYRKEKFIEYSGDYNIFIKNAVEKMPLIVVVLNNYDNFIESYEIYNDRFSTVVREGNKYGIVTILSATSQSVVRYKLRQNFQREFVLHLNDEFEYSSILGKNNVALPNDIKGRGLVKLDDVYEYQTAYPFEEEQVIDSIRELNNNLKQKFTVRAKKIPTLPEIVNYNYFANNINSLEEVPIGIDKEELNTFTYDFSSKEISLVLGQEIPILKSFINELTRVLSKINTVKLLVIDTENIIKQSTDTLIYKDGFEELINHLHANLKELLQNNLKVVCIIVGVDSLMSKLNQESKNKLCELLDKSSTIKFIFADMAIKIKKIEFEKWYKDNTINTNGIWIGNGLANQYSIIVNKVIGQYRDEIQNNFGYAIINGKPTFLKILESDKNE